MTVAPETVDKFISSLTGGVSSLTGMWIVYCGQPCLRQCLSCFNSFHFKNLLRFGLLGSTLKRFWLIRCGISVLRCFQAALRMLVQDILGEPPASVRNFLVHGKAELFSFKLSTILFLLLYTDFICNLH